MPCSRSQINLYTNHDTNRIRLYATSTRFRGQEHEVNHGADSHIRELRNCMDDFPICKLAINDRQKRLLRDKVYILRFLSALDSDIAVPRTDPCPLQDNEGIFGFRMEGLDSFLGESVWDTSARSNRHSISCIKPESSTTTCPRAI
ncbi:Uncharacterized protein TPAR_01302 [Tolypocladium paradoxum]|uniref:Uncharacterized protein n=1 Tax=Tolypocladium paradoxum TaxID=94208 RepID=A0A2S4L7U6_9HYPO|nr:Uncharacterized protein TPAR_01302 [Tolypocladium paradoxum]